MNANIIPPPLPPRPKGYPLQARQVNTSNNLLHVPRARAGQTVRQKLTQLSSHLLRQERLASNGRISNMSCGQKAYHLEMHPACDGNQRGPPSSSVTPCLQVVCPEEWKYALTDLLHPPYAAVFQKPQFFGLRTNTLVIPVNPMDARIEVLTAGNGVAPTQSAVAFTILRLDDYSTPSFNAVIDCLISNNPEECEAAPHTELTLRIQMTLSKDLPDSSYYLVGWYLQPPSQPSQPSQPPQIPVPWISTGWTFDSESSNGIPSRGLLDMEYTISHDRETPHIQLDTCETASDPQACEQILNSERMVNELIENERTYVMDLYELIDYMIVPLEARPDLYADPHILEIFQKSRIQDIADLHHAMLIDLDKQTDVQGVLKVIEYYFTTFYSTLVTLYKSFYSVYQEGSGLPRYVSTLTYKKKYPAYSPLFAQIVDTHTPSGLLKVVSPLDFYSMWILPVQHLPRYVLFLRQIKTENETDEASKQVAYRSIDALITEAKKVLPPL